MEASQGANSTLWGKNDMGVTQSNESEEVFYMIFQSEHKWELDSMKKEKDQQR